MAAATTRSKERATHHCNITSQSSPPRRKKKFAAFCILQSSSLISSSIHYSPNTHTRRDYPTEPNARLGPSTMHSPSTSSTTSATAETQTAVAHRLELLMAAYGHTLTSSLLALLMLLWHLTTCEPTLQYGSFLVGRTTASGFLEREVQGRRAVGWGFVFFAVRCSRWVKGEGLCILIV